MPKIIDLRLAEIRYGGPSIRNDIRVENGKFLRKIGDTFFYWSPN